MDIKQWRPDGWKQPSDIYCRLADAECIPKLSYFEAGADAMLEALRAMGFNAESIRDIKIPEPHETITIPTLERMKELKEVRGKWVLIPDEEEDNVG